MMKRSPTPAEPHRWVKSICLSPPSLGDNTADADRLAAALNKAFGTTDFQISLEQTRALSGQLRAWNWKVRAVCFKSDPRTGILVHLAGPENADRLCGLAVDLGSTRVVLRLVDLETGTTVGERVFDNPQIAIGPDILTRIHHADTEGGLSRLHRLIIDGINTELSGLCQDCGVLQDTLHLAAISGNTAMTHLLLGITPHWMIREPYIPALNQPGLFTAAELGLFLSASAQVMVFPNVGSYFGGDLISGILYADLDQREEVAMIVDVGTNAEVVLGNRDWMIACAGAAGPALEGGVTRMGTTAGPGVIDRVAIDPDTLAVDLHTIEDKPPRGICGSGVIDLAAALFLSGMVDIRGKLRPERCKDRFFVDNGVPHLILAPAAVSATGTDLSVSQADLDSLIRSKAAMYTILETLAASAGMRPEEIATFFVAGTFGAYIDPRSAIAIGMLPDLPLSRYQSLGNSSLGGATRVLTEADCLDRVKPIRDSITYLELNVNQDFMNRFSAAKFLPHTDRSRFPSVPFPPDDTGNGFSGGSTAT
ncbi:ASKHA domain-containing protein [Desulfosarcina sp. OttesenSCG-928-G10]|nr:ASKHA domain-containing protein [Desulfosarcina sp. OttesenSCG-928-G10]MDL2321661.1 ASKHA domain-containing protein [Desulfosarcina sp. OttesenSCG-928-B08]